MVAQRLRLHALLDELEEELRQLDWWEQHAPSAQALQSQEPFCIDTLEFAQWLQWVFISRMRTLLNVGHALPNQCAIHEAAEVVYAEQLASVASLLRCLKAIDSTIVTAYQLH